VSSIQLFDFYPKLIPALMKHNGFPEIDDFMLEYQIIKVANSMMEEI
jgi:hypothetical protein